MPQIPPWIRPPEDLGQAYISAFQAGASVAARQASLQADADAQSVRFTAEAQRMQEQQLREQQELEMQKQFHAATLGLRQQSINQDAVKLQLAAKTAGERMAALTNYQKMIAAGVAPEEAALRNPAMFPSAAGLGTLIRAAAEKASPFAPSDVTTPGGVNLVRVGPQHYILAPKSKTEEAEVKPVLDENRKEIPGIKLINGRIIKIAHDNPNKAELTQFLKQRGGLLFGNIPTDKNALERYNAAWDTYNKLKSGQPVAGMQPAQQMMPKAGPASASQAPMLMMSKTGDVVEVPADRVEWAKQHGYTPR